MKRKKRPRFSEAKITFDGFLIFCYFWIKPKVKRVKGGTRCPSESNGVGGALSLSYKNKHPKTTPFQKPPSFIMAIIESYQSAVQTRRRWAFKKDEENVGDQRQ